MNVFRLVLWQGTGLVVCGVALGMGAAWIVTRFLTSFLYGISATDRITFAIIPAVLACVAGIACYIPARRATKVDPLVALRYE